MTNKRVVEVRKSLNNKKTYHKFGGVCVERGCPRPNSHIPQIHPRKNPSYKKQKYLHTLKI